MEKIYIKNQKMFKNKKQMIIYILIFCLFIYLFIYLGTRDFNPKLRDNERFSKEFNLVETENVFKYTNASKVRSIASGISGIVLFGTNNEWVNYYAKILNDVAISEGITEIYYYDFIKNRQDNNGTYEDIVNKLSDYVTYNDLGKAEIYAPSLLIMKNGKVLLFDTDTAFIDGSVTPEIYWNNFTIGAKKQELIAAFDAYLGK